MNTIKSQLYRSMV